MKVTVFDIIRAWPILSDLGQQRLPGVASLRVNRLAVRVLPEFRAACAARDTLINESNSVALANGARQVKPELIQEFLAAPLFSETIELDVKPLTPADIADAQLSAQDIEELGPLFADAE